jgi:hypothetical protein
MIPTPHKSRNRRWQGNRNFLYIRLITGSLMHDRGSLKDFSRKISKKINDSHPKAKMKNNLPDSIKIYNNFIVLSFREMIVVINMQEALK